jgi:hypothetical protein
MHDAAATSACVLAVWALPGDAWCDFWVDGWLCKGDLAQQHLKCTARPVQTRMQTLMSEHPSLLAAVMGAAACVGVIGQCGHVLRASLCIGGWWKNPSDHLLVLVLPAGFSVLPAADQVL